MIRSLYISLAAACLAASVSAHDIWVETTANLVRAGDWVGVSLMLGNHGNGHRDFRLASKVAAGDQNLTVFGPKGQKWDIGSSLADNGFGPKEGFWAGKFQADEPGLYIAASSFDKVMTFGPVRDVKSAKAFFVVTPSMDKVSMDNPGFDRVLGHPLELVPVVNPVTPMGPGSKLKVRVLFQGKPMANVKVSFIPRGSELKGEIDAAYERMTDAEGEAELELREPNAYLVAARFVDDKAKGEGYESIHYSATMFMLLPAICPCCGG